MTSKCRNWAALWKIRIKFFDLRTYWQLRFLLPVNHYLPPGQKPENLELILLAIICNFSTVKVLKNILVNFIEKIFHVINKQVGKNVSSSCFYSKNCPLSNISVPLLLKIHEYCAKNVCIWSFSGPYFPVISPSARKYGPGKLRMRTLFT